MRTNIDNRLLPGIQCEQTITLGNEIARTQVFMPSGEYAGEVVLIARRRKAPAGSASSTGFVTDYGWRPARSAPQSKLTDKVEAVKTMLTSRLHPSV